MSTPEQAQPPHRFPRGCVAQARVQGDGLRTWNRMGDGACPFSARTASQPWAPASAGEAVWRGCARWFGERCDGARRLDAEKRLTETPPLAPAKAGAHGRGFNCGLRDEPARR